jgi:hypothetical protein
MMEDSMYGDQYSKEISHCYCLKNSDLISSCLKYQLERKCQQLSMRIVMFILGADQTTMDSLEEELIVGMNMVLKKARKCLK